MLDARDQFNDQPNDTFVRRHIGPSEAEQACMLQHLGLDSLAALLAQSVPASILRTTLLHLPAAAHQLAMQRPRGEHEVLQALRRVAAQNRPMRSLIGMGYYDSLTPAVIQRNVLEDPGWYTQYTPYQAEIAQGRLTALLHFQTMVSDLCGLEIANASLLDEATAAAEAMGMAWALHRQATQPPAGAPPACFFASHSCHPQSLAVLQTRAEALQIPLVVGDAAALQACLPRCFAALLQYPDTYGQIGTLADIAAQLHAQQSLLIVATDLLALTLLQPPGACGADIAVGSAQRFGVPLGNGGPHAAFLACHAAYKRLLPGRLIGVSRDAQGNPALRMCLQTREQHIRRERATSNICTAQALLASMATLYAIYHGPQGLQQIAGRIRQLTCLLAAGLQELGYRLLPPPFFDTLLVYAPATRLQQLRASCEHDGINLRYFAEAPGQVGIALDELSSLAEVQQLWQLFAAAAPDGADVSTLQQRVEASPALQQSLQAWQPIARTTACLPQSVFQPYHSEHAMLRYIQRLRQQDLSLTHAMIPLGSCTMKLNASVEMLPLSWPQFAQVHPYAPSEQQRGYQQLFADLHSWLAEITGLAAVSLQPNAGAQGEYAGLLVIRAYHRARGAAQRHICLIPVSAHGTNPASAAMAGMQVVTVQCDAQGNIDLADLSAKAATHAEHLAALMVTYPSTHGVFEPHIRDVCAVVHQHGGQVYLDGANMNAQVGVCRPGDFGSDVCHLNLHKTFCIPHGGGGPGMGPIAVAAHLAPFLPQHPLAEANASPACGAIAAAPYGSASILTIAWMYLALMGSAGLRQATAVAILNANYMAWRLQPHYPILYRGPHGRVAHEFILDTRAFKQSCGIEAEDIAKRLIDYGFHAPTMSFPVSNTLMLEPTESENQAELDAFCDALISIRGEIAAIERGEAARDNNILKHAPHTAAVVCATTWERPYSREQAAFPNPRSRQAKFWPAVGRVDNVYGDRHLLCVSR